MGRPRKTEEEKKAAKAAYMREYARAHRAEMNANRRRWKKRHPEEARKQNAESQRKWREKNRERYNAYHRAWRAKRKAELDKNGQA